MYFIQFQHWVLSMNLASQINSEDQTWSSLVAGPHNFKGLLCERVSEWLEIEARALNK